MIKVLQCGLGSMGSLMARIALDKRELELVGAVARRKSLHGTDLGEYLDDERARGLKIVNDLQCAAAATDAVAVMTATGSFLSEESVILRDAIGMGLNVVSIAEEMAYPQMADEEQANFIDSAAREQGVTVLGTGINPGFVLDLLIIALTGICRRVDSIYAERVNDLAPYGGKVMQTQGIGLTPEAFEEGLRSGTVVGHIGFRQSLGMIADAIGFELDDIVEERVPIVAQKARTGAHIEVAPGMVAGCRHTARGYRAGQVLIELVHPQQIEPAAENQKTWDRLVIEGEPHIELKVEPEMAGGLGTASIAVNMVPLVVAAEPGLKTMKDLPVPRMAALRASP